MIKSLPLTGSMTGPVCWASISSFPVTFRFNDFGAMDLNWKPAGSPLFWQLSLLTSNGCPEVLPYG
jgi:hypothetical protein